MKENIVFRLKSNIILKSIYEKDRRGSDYVPMELLQAKDKSYFNTQNEIFWTQTQKIRYERLLWYATKVVDIEEENPFPNVEIKKEDILLDTEDKKGLSIINEKLRIDDKLYIQENSYDIEENLPVILEVNPIITTVLNKYPLEKNLFCKYVSTICSEIGDAVTYNDKNKYDDIVFSLDKIRESYRKLIHIILELKLGFNVKSLGDYYKPINSFKLEEFCRDNNMDMTYINNLREFHDLINAFGHKNENSDRRSQNNNKIESFKKRDIKNRASILLAVPAFLSHVNLTNAEMKSLSSKLSIN